MDQLSLFLIVSALTGIFSSRWALRLDKLQGELALKTILATVLAGIIALSSFTSTLASPLHVVIGLVTALYIYSPIILTSLARTRRYRLADGLTRLLYWSAPGRYAVRRLLSQIALQQGDTKEVSAIIPERDADPLLLSQLYAAEQNWQAVLALELPDGGDNAALGFAARIEALLALGKSEEADAEFASLKQRFTSQQGPLTYRSLRLSEARIAAERGNIRKVQELLGGGVDGSPAHVLFAIAARAAEQAGSDLNAVRLYKQAYTLAPGTQRLRYAARLERYDEPLPDIPIQQQSLVATMTLAAVLAAAYAVQVGLSQRFDLANANMALTVPQQYGMSSAQVIAGFILNITVPASNAPWRYLSYAFLHGGIVHLGFNLWVLFDIGRLFEARRNWSNVLAAFVFGTALGAYLTLLAQAGDILILVGASGGILGIAGALLADTWRGTTAQDKQLTRSLTQWMVIIVLFSFAIPGVSLWGHVGGVVGGLLWGFIRQGLPPSKTIDRVAGGLSIALLAYTLSQVAALFFRLY